MRIFTAAMMPAALLCVLLAAAGADPASKPAPRKAARKPAAARGKALPDSVLARAAGRDITVSSFRRAWDQLQPPQRPESLTPESAREFLDLLIGKELIGARAGRERWVWTSEESLRHESLRDRLTLGVSLDSALAATRRELGDGSLNDGAVGEAARDSFAARQNLRWDEPLLERLAKAFGAIPKPRSDSSLMAQIRMLGTPPVVAPEDRTRAIATGRDGPFTADELLLAWSRLNPLSRPRVSTASQVRDLVKNGLFERALRRDARARAIEGWPAITAQLAHDTEFIAVQHLVAREVYGKIPMDSATVRSYFAREAGIWKLPMRVRLLTLTLADRPSALAMMVRLASPAEAESLAARAARSQLSYWSEVSAESDSALFARSMRAGAGGVVGPDSTARGWRVARVAEVEPPRLRRYEEVSGLVQRHWYDLEAERRIVELLERLRKEGPVAINTRALGALTAR